MGKQRKTGWLTPTELAAAIGVTEHAVRSAMRKGRLTVRADGKLDARLATREWEQNRKRAPGPGRPRTAPPVETPQARRARGAKAPAARAKPAAREKEPAAADEEAIESLFEAQTRKEIALADLREMEVQKRRGELLEADEVAREWADVLRRVRAGVLAVTSRIRARLPHLTTEDGAVIDRELRDALASLGEGGLATDDGGPRADA